MDKTDTVPTLRSLFLSKDDRHRFRVSSVMSDMKRHWRHEQGGLDEAGGQRQRRGGRKELVREIEHSHGSQAGAWK